MEYVFFDNDPKNFAAKLFNTILRPSLPSFVAHLQRQKEDNERKKLNSKKAEQILNVDIVDDEFIDNIAQIDRIIASGKQTRVDKFYLSALFKDNHNYEKYFYKKLAENGLV